MGERRRGLEPPFALAGRSLSEDARGLDDEDDDGNAELIWDGADARAGASGEGAAVAFGRAGGDRSVGGFLGNDRSLARGSFVDEPATERMASSILRFFCKLAFRSASSSRSFSSRDGFFRLTLVVVVGVCLSSTLSFSLSLSDVGIFFDMRIVEVALGFLSWLG